MTPPTRVAAVLAVIAMAAAVPTISAVADDLLAEPRPGAAGDPRAGRPVEAAGPQIRTAPDPARPAARPAAPALGERVAEEPTTTITGWASWYGPGFAGQRTASGEIYDPSEMVAAHRSLAFGTQVRVTNQRNGRSVVVRITDRGPYAGGRVLDVSQAAADVLGMRGSGTAPVSIEVL